MLFRSTRKRHDANLEQIRLRAAEQAAAEAGPGIASGEVPAPSKT